MTRSAVVRMLNAEVKRLGTQRAAAEAWGMRASYLSEILGDKRHTVAIPARVLAWIGVVAEVKTVVTYKKKVA